MKNNQILNELDEFTEQLPEKVIDNGTAIDGNEVKLPEITFITSYPPRECGIATYSQDLIEVLNNKFNQSFTIKICALESENEIHDYFEEIKYTLNVDEPGAFANMAETINQDPDISLVVIQHEFGFFEKSKKGFHQFLEVLEKPVITVFHTVLPNPNSILKTDIQVISNLSKGVIVMTNNSSKILTEDYDIPIDKIKVIPHGTHLVLRADKTTLKEKYKLTGRKKILSTFGLLSSGKSIETTLNALPAIIKENPDVLFLIIGKTHPSVVKQDGEIYREMLLAKITELKIQNHVHFVNKFLPLHELLEYLQLTDVYLFTSKDPLQAVSGTFSYAISSGCPVISTPIPHAREVLSNEAGIIIDFDDDSQLAQSVLNLLEDEELRRNISSNGLHKMASTAWENAAVAHAVLFETMSEIQISLQYNIPPINLKHFKEMTTDFAMLQFSKMDQPDIESGYTLDDNARAMIAMCQYLDCTKDQTSIVYIERYLNFIRYCIQNNGFFLNYVDKEGSFTEQNYSTNLEDSNGRAIWALGYLISLNKRLPDYLVNEALSIMANASQNVKNMYSSRAMAFTIKGLYYQYTVKKSESDRSLVVELADRLVQMYRHESDDNWHWFESYLTYANSTLPEAMLCAWSVTGDQVYKEVARKTFKFLLGKTFGKNGINVISNKQWLYRKVDLFPIPIGGEQPIDVAYTVLALRKFYEVFKDDQYLIKMKIAFDWFLGKNHLKQIIYNPCTGGCYDGLEDNYVNLNQGAESTVSYLMARLTVDKYFNIKKIS
ncbi:glycosyltransferase [Polluticaenibacter yanchengensis]|uniref:Glycosyltransferase n=1 Tax=Polluticaenibacter yanchengensis TaxID=3014562 RepID=A0ABT4UF99_9BACT|nr:glycosyltransferase [Chitinophagaceae bacterium LY-5]